MVKNMDGAASDGRRSNQVQGGSGNRANRDGSRSSGSRQSVAGLELHRSFPMSPRHRTEPVNLEELPELEGATSSATRRRSCPNQRKTQRQVEDGGPLERGTR